MNTQTPVTPEIGAERADQSPIPDRPSPDTHPSPIPSPSSAIIVCGLGHVGYRIVCLLRRLGEPVTVVAQTARPEWRRAVEEMGVRVVEGDARDRQVLEQAGIEDARALVTAMDQDLVSIETALDARQAHPGLPIVMRLFDQTLARQFAAAFDIRHASAMSALAAPAFAAAAMGEEIEGSFRLAGAPYVAGCLPLATGSPLVGETVGHVEERHRVSVLVVEPEDGESAVAPAPETVLRAGDRVTLLAEAAHWRDLAAPCGGDAPPPHLAKCRGASRRPGRPSLWARGWRSLRRVVPLPLGAVFLILNLLILLSVFVFHAGMKLSAVDALYFVITTVTTVGYGDITPRDATPALKLYGCLLMILGSATIATLYSIITDIIVTARFQQLLGRRRAPQQGHTIVVGLGSIGYRVVEELRAAGIRMVGIERNPDCEFQEAVRGHTAIVTGDGRLAPSLQEAGIERAAAIIAATDNDVVNLGVGLAARQLNPTARTVVRLFDADFAQKVQTLLQIDAALSGSLIAAPTFAAAALLPGVLCAWVHGGRLLILVQRPAGEEWAGLTPAQVRERHDEVVLLRRHSAGASFRAGRADEPLRAAEEVLALVCRELR